MKNLILILVILPVLALGQKKSKKEGFKDDVYGRTIKKEDESITPQTLIIPLKNNAIFYEEIGEASGEKSEIYIKARKWFVDNFRNAKSVLQVEDKESGILTGKALYIYSFHSGLNTSDVSLYFTLNVDIRDGKYRIQFYDMYGSNTKTNSLADGLNALSSGLSGSVYNENDAKSNHNVNYTEAYQKFLNGKSKKFNTKLLKGMDDQVKLLFESFKGAVNTEIEDF